MVINELHARNSTRVRSLEILGGRLMGKRSNFERCGADNAGCAPASPPEVQQHISIDIALHYGDAAYGNIGSGNRLDFTAVGRDINILGRLELLCKEYRRPLFMTGAFAAEVAAAPVFEIGHFELRGFRQHQSLYGLCQDGEVPAAPTWTDGA